MGKESGLNALERLAIQLYIDSRGGELPPKKHITASVKNIERAERVLSIVDATKFVYEVIQKFQKLRALRKSRQREVCAQESRTKKLDAIKRKRAARAFFAQYRHDDGGHTGLYVKFTDEPAEIGVTSWTETDWNVYRGQFKGWAYRTVNTRITLPRLWYNRVYRHGLHNLDDMMCLDATPLDGAPSGVELYAAKWLVQSKGYSVRIESGVIARRNDLAYHSKDAAGALRGLRKKLAISERWSAVRGLPLESLVNSIGKAVQGWTISVSDARKMGACEFGIRHWCEVVGLDYSAGSASFFEVYQAYIRHPAKEARAVLLDAIRRNKGVTGHLNGDTGANAAGESTTTNAPHLSKQSARVSG